MRVIVTVSTQETERDPMVTRDTFTVTEDDISDDDGDLGGYIMNSVRSHFA